MVDAVIFSYSGDAQEWIGLKDRIPSVGRIVFLTGNDRISAPDGMEAMPDFAGLIASATAKYILLIDGQNRIEIAESDLQRMIEVAEDSHAGIVYSDYRIRDREQLSNRPVNDYQMGSVRDDFDFGKIMLLSVSAARDALERFGRLPETLMASLYDLRLKISINHELVHIPEYLYTAVEKTLSDIPGERHFDYVDPANREVQIEMEQVFTEHLKRIGAYLPPVFEIPRTAQDPYPVEASVIIPVKNRKATIGEAIASALSQVADFKFNVLVIDNYSTDGTGEAISRLAEKYRTVLHIIPKQLDLGIGGCWNEAIFAKVCGRYAVQLDSDDLYSGSDTLQKIIDLFRKGDYAMVIGSYTLVNEQMQTIPPGLIDHREWTDHNGRNNALRINGLGAPRAFRTDVIRETGFLNVSYGEDYAAALAISRRYRIGRIYDSLYLCRRWSGNTDALLTPEQKNRNDAFKDGIRTLEIQARQNYLAQRGSEPE